MGAVVKRVLFYTLVIFLAIYAIFPFYYAVVSSFHGGSAFDVSLTFRNFSLDNYKAVFSIPEFRRSILNSFIVSFGVVIISLFLSITAAYAISRLRFPGKPVLMLMILSVSMFPNIAVLTGLMLVVAKLGWNNTYFSLFYSYMIFILPFTVWVLATFMRDIPRELEEAAMVDGAGPFTIIFRIFMPIMMPSLVTTGLLAFIAAWNEFLFAFTFMQDGTKRTVTVAIANFSGTTARETPFLQIMAASVVVTVPLIILVMIFQKKIVSGLTAGAVKG